LRIIGSPVRVRRVTTWSCPVAVELDQLPDELGRVLQVAVHEHHGVTRGRRQAGDQADSLPKLRLSET
jgi:hypothetical protein